MNKIERAIESTKNRIHYITVNSENGTPSYCVKAEKQVEIQNVILDALEKQIPKKVYHFLEDDTFETTCCGCDVANKDYKYCPECGCLLGEVEEVEG